MATVRRRQRSYPSAKENMLAYGHHVKGGDIARYTGRPAAGVTCRGRGRQCGGVQKWRSSRLDCDLSEVGTSLC